MFRQAGPPRRVDWYRIAGCAMYLSAATLMLSVAYALTVLVLSSGQP